MRFVKKKKRGFYSLFVTAGGFDLFSTPPVYGVVFTRANPHVHDGLISVSIVASSIDISESSLRRQRLTIFQAPSRLLPRACHSSWTELVPCRRFGRFVSAYKAKSPRLFSSCCSFDGFGSNPVWTELTAVSGFQSVGFQSSSCSALCAADQSRRWFWSSWTRRLSSMSSRRTAFVEFYVQKLPQGRSY